MSTFLIYLKYMIKNYFFDVYKKSDFYCSGPLTPSLNQPCYQFRHFTDAFRLDLVDFTMEKITNKITNV